MVAIFTLLIVPGAALAGDPSPVGQVALEYARGFDGLLAAEPAEAKRLGVDRATLATLKVTAIHPVKTLDQDFLAPADERSLDEALEDTGLYWVVLSDKGGVARLQVAVTWPAGTLAPEPAGLNWIDASAISAAESAAADEDAPIVWIPEDVSVLLAGPEHARRATPIATDTELKAAKLERRPEPVGSYSASLHGRLRSYVPDGPAVEQGGSGAGLPANHVGGSPGVPPVGPVAAVCFLAAIAAILLRQGRSGAR